MSLDPAAVSVREVTKRFPGVVANSQVSFDIRKGEIHALLGENGAGKSTLMNILSGLYSPDEGGFAIHGKPATFASPGAAIRAGVGMVHQHFMLVPTFTVAENIVLGTYRSGRGVVLDLGVAVKEVRDLSERYSLAADPTLLTSQLTVSSQQKVEILKLLYRGADILILDEPTAVLAPQEVRELFGILRNLADQGRTVILVTHKLDEVMSIAERVTVLRGGLVVASELPVRESNPAQLARLLIGRELPDPPRRQVATSTRTVVELDAMTIRDDRGIDAVCDLSLRVHAHEVVGIAGVDGNGQAELAEALSGLRPLARGRMVLDGREAAGHDPGYMIRNGVATIPEDRHRFGFVLDFNAAENVALPQHGRAPFARRGLMDWGKIKQAARDVMTAFDVRPAEPDVKVRTLSGGNQQKLMVGRELSRKPTFIVASHPTRGLDIQAVDYLHRQLILARDGGAGILLISQDLKELLELSDHVVVMYRGAVAGEFPAAAVDLDVLGQLMLTGRASTPKVAAAG